MISLKTHAEELLSSQISMYQINWPKILQQYSRIRVETDMVFRRNKLAIPMWRNWLLLSSHHIAYPHLTDRKWSPYFLYDHHSLITLWATNLILQVKSCFSFKE